MKIPHNYAYNIISVVFNIFLVYIKYRLAHIGPGNIPKVMYHKEYSLHPKVYKMHVFCYYIVSVGILLFTGTIIIIIKRTIKGIN